MTLQATRDLLDPDKIFCVWARVALHEGETEFWEINAEGQISIDVITLKSHVPMTVVMRGGDFERNGFWTIPALDTEVLVSFDEDGMEGDGALVACMGRAPTAIGPDKILVLHDNVEIRSVNGTAVSLAKKSDAEAAATWDANHIHLDSTGNPTSGPLKNAIPGDGIIPNPPTFTPPFLPGASPGGATIQGTDVLKGE